MDLEKMREEVISRAETCWGNGEEGNILEKVRNFNYELHKNRVKKYLEKATIVRVSSEKKYFEVTQGNQRIYY